MPFCRLPGPPAAVSPILQFVLAVAVFNEPFAWADKVSFALIWCGLALYTLEGLWIIKGSPFSAGREAA